MIDYVSSRRKSYYFQMIKRHILDNKFCYIGLLVFFVVGVLIGIFTASGISDKKIDLLMDTVLLRFFNDEISFFVFLILRLFYDALLLVAIIVCSLNIWLTPLIGLCILYRGYNFSFNITLIFLTLGVGGVFCGVVIFIPCWLLSVAIYFNCACMFFNRCLNNKKYGKVGYSDCMLPQKLVITYLIMLAMIALIEAILISLIVLKFLIE